MSIPNPVRLAALQQRLGHQFSDLSLLHRALTHRSAQKDHNERLEFLGDALIGMIAAATFGLFFASAASPFDIFFAGVFFLVAFP